MTCFIHQHSGYLEVYTQAYRHTRVTIKNREKMKSQASFLKTHLYRIPKSVTFEVNGCVTVSITVTGSWYHRFCVNLLRFNTIYIGLYFISIWDVLSKHKLAPMTLCSQQVSHMGTISRPVSSPSQSMDQTRYSYIYILSRSFSSIGKNILQVK